LRQNNRAENWRQYPQIAAIGRRSTERIEPIPSLPFEYWLDGSLLWLA